MSNEKKSSFEILFEKCQKIKDGKKYNLATDDFYDYLRLFGINITPKQSNQLKPK